jgi:hypothetical protein
MSERRHLASAHRTAAQRGKDGAVAQALGGRDVRRVQERLSRAAWRTAASPRH